MASRGVASEFYMQLPGGGCGGGRLGVGGRDARVPDTLSVVDVPVGEIWEIQGNPSVSVYFPPVDPP